ncbi:endosomal/lysosomal potassium channel TMEM175-like [Dendronephthya gigantea]|uniref:endosomal/lysosomal potassium channel TMEM175-like n=1 Tax=Dendronephthya gigantea TaxID=151771 RepID=UPI0010698014|nr:endosomal/lysosomal potassium channel TMEM175-like [Dendronephthya gigantea]
MEQSLDYYDAGRLQSFSDAVAAIVATILILPLRNVLVSDKGSFVEYLQSHQDLIIVYFVAFLVICSVWESHIMRWIVISSVDDVLVWLNITSLLFVSFLPFVVRLVGQYTQEKTPIVLACGLLLVLELIELIMIFYTFTQHKLLRAELKNSLPFELQQKRNYILKRKLLNPVLYIFGAGLSFVSVKISWVLIILVVIAPCINRLVEVLTYKIRFLREEQHMFLYENIICKERVECYSDGVYAIVATLLVLDITADNFPTNDKVKKDGIEKTLANMRSEYLTYVGTFAVCGLLWFVHYSLFYSLKKVNYLMMIVNNVSLSCVGTLPFLVSILNKYVDSEHKNDRHAIQFGCLIVGVAGLCQFMIFTIALGNSQRYLTHHVIPVGSRTASHNYLLIKLLIIPMMAIIIFGTSFANMFEAYISYNVLVLATPLLFIFIKFVYCCIMKNQVVIMNVIQDEQPEWSNPTTSNPLNTGATFSASYDQYK